MNNTKDLVSQRNIRINTLFNKGITKTEDIRTHLEVEGYIVTSSIINNVIQKMRKEVLESSIEKVNSLEKSKQKLQDKTNLVNRQLRAINRKEYVYEEFLEQLDILVKDKIKFPKLSQGRKTNLKRGVTCVLLSDTHADEVISRTETAGNEEFNFKIFQSRLRKYEREIITKQLKDNNKFLSIFLLGDMISGMIHEELYENGESGKVEILYKTALVITKFILNISEYFDEVYIQTKQGNHGRFSKGFKYKRTDENWDNIIYLMIKSLTSSYQEKIHWNISTEFIDFVSIQGFKIGYMHGDEVNHTNIDKNYSADLFVQGHTHTANYNLQTKFLTNGAFNKGNGWVAKKLTYKAEEQHQVIFTLEFNEELKKYELDQVKFIEITKDINTEDTYLEELTEETLFGGKTNYIENTFEIVFGNYN